MLTDATSHRIVYSILTPFREYSNAIQSTPFLSDFTTTGVVAGTGPEADFPLDAEESQFPLEVFADDGPPHAWVNPWNGTSPGDTPVIM